jgi:hypothetical protein
MVNRTVWFVYATSILRGVVLKQNFTPDYLVVKADKWKEGETTTLIPYSAHLKPEGAIAEARDNADLLNRSADELEAKLQDEPEETSDEQPEPATTGA